MGRQVDSEKESQRSRTTQIIVALISAAAAILVAYWQFVPSSLVHKKEDAERRFTGRVSDEVTASKVRGAKVSLEAQGVPPILYTDSEGIFYFTVPDTVHDVRIVVEASGYEPYDRRVDLGAVSGMEDIRLIRLGSVPSADSSEPSTSLTPPAAQGTSGNLGEEKPSGNASEDEQDGIYNCSATVTSSSRKLQVEDPGESCWLKLEFGLATAITFHERMQVTYQLAKGSDVYFYLANPDQTLTDITAATIRPWRLVMSKGGSDGVKQLEIDYHSRRSLCLRDGNNNLQPLTSSCR